MSLRLDPRGLRSIEQVIADLSKTAAELSPIDPRAAKIAKMVKELREIEADRSAQGLSGNPTARMS